MKYLEVSIQIALPLPEDYEEGDEVPSTYVTTEKVVTEVMNDGWEFVSMTIEDEPD